MSKIKKQKKLDIIALYDGWNDDDLVAVLESIDKFAAYVGTSINSARSTISQIAHKKITPIIYLNGVQRLKVHLYYK